MSRVSTYNCWQFFTFYEGRDFSLFAHLLGRGLTFYALVPVPFQGWGEWRGPDAGEGYPSQACSQERETGPRQDGLPPAPPNRAVGTPKQAMPWGTSLAVVQENLFVLEHLEVSVFNFCFQDSEVIHTKNVIWETTKGIPPMA